MFFFPFPPSHVPSLPPPLYLSPSLNIHLTVCDDHVFKDDKLFYRFRKDDGTFEEPPDAAILAKGQRIYGRSAYQSIISSTHIYSVCK